MLSAYLLLTYVFIGEFYITVEDWGRKVIVGYLFIVLGYVCIVHLCVHRRACYSTENND